MAAVEHIIEITCWHLINGDARFSKAKRLKWKAREYRRSKKLAHYYDQKKRSRIRFFLLRILEKRI